MVDSKLPSPKRRRIDSVDVGDSHDVNWRDEICEALELANSITDEVLLDAIKDLREDCHDTLSTKVELPGVEPHYKNLYRIRCSNMTPSLDNSGALYEDLPTIKGTDGKDFHLSANMRVTNLDLYIQRYPGMSFAAIHEFVCCNENGQNPIGPMEEWGESLLLASEDLGNALLGLKGIPSFEIGRESQHWSFWAFHNIDTLQKLPSLFDGVVGKHVSLFSEYFCETKQSDFHSTRKLISNGQFNRRSLGYLFVSVACSLFS